MSDGNPDTPYEIARWRGQVDEKLSNLKDDARKAVEATADIATDVKTLQTQVTRLVTISGIVAFFGSAIVSIVVGLIFKVYIK